jgi:pimeloyl-ACP methyl ester carboxylesterase
MRGLLLGALLMAGCRDPASVSAGPTETSIPTAIPTATATPTPTANPTLPPITAFFESLPVEGHPDAFVSLPTGATAKRPVVVVIHGAGDRPDWQCGGWRRATGEYAFVLCPTGHFAPGDSTKDDRRYTHANGSALLAYIDASLAALAARYPDHADTANPVLAGFSLGSYGILAIAVRQPSRFQRIALIEGATSQFDDSRARAFVKGGGQRVLFGCGQRGCETAAKAAAERLRTRDQLDARVVFAPVNHTFDPPLEDAVHAELAWLVEGDDRWPTHSP